jgi:hypothetical protein
MPVSKEDLVKKVRRQTRRCSRMCVSARYWNTLWRVQSECACPNLQGKIKVKLSLCFNRALRHEGVLREWRYSSTHSLTSALGGGGWSASCPGHFTPRERVPGTHWIGGWVGPRAVLDAAVKRKIPSPSREWNPRTSIVQPVAQRYTDWAITALNLQGLRNVLLVISSPTLYFDYVMLKHSCGLKFMLLHC